MGRSVAIGPIATNHNDGLLRHYDHAGNLIPGWLAARDFERRQPVVPVRLGHLAEGGPIVGTAAHYEYEPVAEELLAVVSLDPPPPPEHPGPPRDLSSMLGTWSGDADLYDSLRSFRYHFSAGISIDHVPGAPGHFCRASLFEIAIVPETAVVGSRPVAVGREDAYLAPRGMPPLWQPIWETVRKRITESSPRRRQPDELEIAGPVSGTKDLAPAQSVRRQSAPAQPIRRRATSAPPGAVLRFQGVWLGVELAEKVIDLVEAGCDFQEISEVLGIPVARS